MMQVSLADAAWDATLALPQPAVIVFAAPPPEFIALPAPVPPPPEIPPKVRAVLEAAIASGDPSAVTAVVRFAKQTNPDVSSLIDAVDADYRHALADAKAREERERRARIATASVLDLWAGSVEAGATRSTGNSNTLGLYGALTGTREGLRWTHKAAARIDFQRTNGVTTTDRSLVSWQPNYKLDERAYAYGVASYERDKLLGFDSRYTAGAGLGYGLVRTTAARLDLEGGPAVRYTDSTNQPSTTTLAGRASLNLKWQFTPTLQFNQASSLYYEPGDTSASATTSLDTKLIGALKARFSYDVKYEHDAPQGARTVDTTSRATLVYSF